MMGTFNIKQVNGLERAKYQYVTARRLGHAPSSALEGAIAAYMLESGDGRERATHNVKAFLNLQPEISGGVL